MFVRLLNIYRKMYAPSFPSTTVPGLSKTPPISFHLFLYSIKIKSSSNDATQYKKQTHLYSQWIIVVDVVANVSCILCLFFLIHTRVHIRVCVRRRCLLNVATIDWWWLIVVVVISLLSLLLLCCDPCITEGCTVPRVVVSAAADGSGIPSSSFFYICPAATAIWVVLE